MEGQELQVQNKKELKEQETTRPGRTFLPDVDIYEEPERLWLWADMPGVDEKTIDVNLADGVLTITGQVALGDYENLSPLYTEYNVGNYMRRFTVSRDVDVDRIQARMNEGVLELELPKADSARPRKIPIAV